jgi:hypothetical protein
MDTTQPTTSSNTSTYTPTPPQPDTKKSWTDTFTGLFKSNPSTPSNVGGRRRKSKRKQLKRKSRKHRKSHKK